MSRMELIEAMKDAGIELAIRIQPADYDGGPRLVVSLEAWGTIESDTVVISNASIALKDLIR